MINYIITSITNYCSELLLSFSLYSNFNLIQAFIFMDNIICGSFFIKQVITSKFTNNLDNQKILDKYYSLYILSILERYTLYLLIYILNKLMTLLWLYYDNDEYNYVLLIITIPFIQNNIINLSLIKRYINKYKEIGSMFISYSISKTFINFIQNLHPKIQKIQNYNIFIVYNLLSINLLWTIIQNCLFLSLLTILRNYECTYYYYKGIKMAYYYNVGYLYNVIPVNDAVYLINLIIKEKRWQECDRLEVLNAFLTLIMHKYNIFSLDYSFLIESHIIILYIFTLYSFIFVFKFIMIYVHFYILLMFIFLHLKIKLTYENIIKILIIYLLCIFNVNDFIITLIILNYNFIHYCMAEIYFYIQNVNNFSKIIKMYDKPSVRQIRNEYVVC